MAEGDNHAKFGGVATDGASTQVLGGVAKDNPETKTRLPEDADRVDKYASAGNKDVLPEHQARRDTYPFIKAL